MKSLYEYILDNDDSIQKLFSSINSLSQNNNCRNLLIKLFRKDNYDTIVFHSFYYITPIQERIITALENNGFKLIFLIPYDEKYSEFYKIWELTYSYDRGYPKSTDWIRSAEHLSNPLGDVYNSSTTKTNNISIHEHKSIVDFIEDVRLTRSKGFEFFSTDHKFANDLLHDYFPNEYEVRNILSYPIGKFIFDVHSCWDNDIGTYAVNDEMILSISATGWLFSKNNTSLDYLDDIRSIIPFFEDCTDLQQWETRLEYLEQMRVLVNESMRGAINDERNLYLANPLMNFSLYALPEKTFNSIKTMFKELFDLLHLLFDDPYKRTIKQHFSMLMKFIVEHSPSDKMNREEIHLLQQMINHIKSDSHGRMYSPRDICSSVLFFLTEDLDHFVEDTPKYNDLVKPSFQLDSASIKGKKIHLLLADIKRLPGKERNYVWPLSQEYIQLIYTNVSTEKQYLLISLMHIMRAFPLLNKYMLFSSINTDDFIISWISRQDKKRLQPSLYIRLLHERCEIPILDTSPEKLSYDLVKEANAGTIQFDFTPVEKNQKLTKEACMDYALCPLKYIYGYVLNPHPHFKSKFTMEHAVRGLITAINSLSIGVSKQTIFDNVYPLFPFFRSSEKRQISDYVSDYSESYSKFDDFKYYDGRFFIEYPSKELLETARLHYGFLMSPKGRTGMDLVNVPDIKKICMYCQFSEDCRRSLHQDDTLPGEINDD